MIVVDQGRPSFGIPGIPALQSQSASHFRTTTFAGTSLTTDTLLEERFAQSSQGLLGQAVSAA
jgi:hypothetical protein